MRSTVPHGPSASLIATTFNCKAGLESALATFSEPASLERLEQIIIVDGGSTDGTWELLEQWAGQTEKAQAIRAAGANISRGRNEAIRRAAGEVIVCFDSGCSYTEGWLDKMLEPFDDPSTQFVGAHTAAYGTTAFERCLAQLYDRRQTSEAYNPSHRGVAYRREVWEAVGGYPEQVAAGEDTWFNTQSRLHGFGFAYAGEARVNWRVRGTWKETFRMMRRNTRGHIALGEPTGTSLLLVIAAIHLGFPIGLALLPLSPWWLAGWLAGYALYVFRRLFRGRRRLFFCRPDRILRGWWAILAFDLGLTTGVVEGGVDRVAARVRRREA